MSLQAMVAAIEQREIGQNEKLLLIVLGNYADQAWECWPSVKRLSADTGMKPRTVSATMAKLEERQLILRQDRWRKDGSRASNLIRLLFGPADSAWGDEVDPGAPRPRKSGAPLPSGAGHEPPNPKPAREPVASNEATARGTRLASDWEPDLVCATLIGLSEEQALREAESFRDYWLGAPGQKGRKADWLATWRNWCRRAFEEKYRGRGSPASSLSPDRGRDQHDQRVGAMLAGAVEAVNRRRRWGVGD